MTAILIPRFAAHWLIYSIMLTATAVLSTMTARAQTALPAPTQVLPSPANPKLPSLFLIGDSTVRNGQGTGTGGQWGWGEPIADLFDPSKINIVNRAVGGLSSRTYLTGGCWDKVKPMIKPGDFVIMQIGTNDNGPINDNFRARNSLPGNGEETQAIDNILTGKHETVHTYGWYLRAYITDTKALGATPIVCSLIPHKSWKDSKITGSPLIQWAAEAAAQTSTRYIDLHEIIAQKYNTMGQAKVEPLFADKGTHTSRAGAELNAACVIAGLKALSPNPLAPYFSVKASDIGTAEAAQVADNQSLSPIK